MPAMEAGRRVRLPPRSSTDCRWGFNAIPSEVELERLIIRNKQDGLGTITLSAVDGRPSLSFASEGREKISLTIPKFLFRTFEGE